MLNVELPYDPVILLPGTYSRKKKKNIYPQKELYLNVYSRIIHNNQNVETSQNTY